MANLVPVRVKIGLRANGEADHPDWTLLPSVPDTKQTEAFLGIHWFYDKMSGHADDDVGSPEGSQVGMVLMDEAMADEAMASLPAKYEVTFLTDAQCETFWNGKVTRHIQRNNVDSKVMTDLKTELDLRKAVGQPTVALEARIAKALDRTDIEPGVRKNPMKVWADFKGRRNITIVDKVTR